ncbi:hypothetical protein MAC_02341 [Metarhizium acridum CQMa 102]|uniref:Uncharacterized protein n=1 Tax=Metarhizium acridum (strain CQMa 102) TaxID=655827 RepID=E9DXJ3_METAQ|nr:uncharacterized protein MAC_02341 [Metarhizium acridum CQMa 102]EFY91751.1 hypothetical protein MAC_02341 [Metarhizium acridum CQMa 102]
MPPKRKALESVSPNIDERSNGKKTKTGAAAAAAAAAQEAPRRRPLNLSHRIPSCSYQIAMQDPRHAYESICICNPLQGRDDEDDDDDDASDEEDEAEDDGGASLGKNDKPTKKACDGGKTCPCGKSAASLPSHEYTMTRAGLARYRMAENMMDLRNPDAFRMHTFGDHMAYGALEVVQNMLMDFNEAYKAKQWREAWSVVEGMALFILVGEGFGMCMADDGEMIRMTAAQLARMVLAALAMLDGEAQLANDTDTKNLGWMMALYQEMAKAMRQQGLLESAQPLNSKAFKFRAGNLSLYLQSYARRRGITVPGAADTANDTDLTMPKTDAKDPWGWARAFAAYRRECVAPVYAYRGWHRQAIGGDGLDISTWTSAERRVCAFDDKDPLPKDAVENLKRGLALGLA